LKVWKSSFSRHAGEEKALTTFTGTNGNDTLVFSPAQIVGFTGGPVSALNDGVADIIDNQGGADLVDLRGSSDNHTFFSGAGKDQLLGGGGRDSYNFNNAAHVEAGEIIDGGTGTDTLNIQIQVGALDLSIASMRSIDILNFLVADGNTATVKLNAAQFSSTGFSLELEVRASPFDALRAIDITMGASLSLDLSGLTFESTWDADDAITITGDSSFETITGTVENDLVRGNGGNDKLNGEGGNDTLEGGDGTDTLDGGSGDDEMRGGAASDLYIVDSESDLVIESFAGGSHDLVQSGNIDIRMSRYGNVEDASLTGSGSFNIFGSDIANILAGNSGKNTIKGFDGDDILNGKEGADTLQGDDGDDFYVVDNSADVVIEQVGEGKADEISTTVSYVLAASAEVETLRAADELVVSNIDLTGNTFSQTIIGNAGKNQLSDGGGTNADVLAGKTGDDFYIVRNSATTIIELSGDGVDKVAVGVSFTLAADDDIERMQTTASGGTSKINLAGNGVAQEIFGNAGDNRLEGKGGSDTLTGLAGKDSFVFAAALGAGNIDAITDFNVADDRFLLSDAIFSALNTGTLSGAFFLANATGLAQDTNDHIIYETDTGKVFYDEDGTGAIAGIQFATITANLALTNADFSVA